MKDPTLEVGSVRIGRNRPLAIIAGPCLAESREMCLEVGHALRDACVAHGFGYVFKASYDKANRSSIHSDRGPGLDEGLQLLEAVRHELGVPVTTDVHEPEQARIAGAVIDLLQIPAFLCRQTDLLLAAGKTGRPINVKKGQFMSPGEMVNVINKLVESGCGDEDIMLTERGTFFGYNRLVNDFVGLGDLLELGRPVCFDVTHSTQQPGGGGTQSGGRPERAPLLARAAVAAGVHALFMEVHPDPARAKSDAASMMNVDAALDLLRKLKRLDQAMGSVEAP